MHDRITPLILTWNEERNLARTIERLRWAKEIVVVDSHSTDATLEIARACPNVRVVQRVFDDFARQWNFGLEQIATPWVLALDADYVLSKPLITELGGLAPDDATSGYRAHFRYCIGGRPLRGSLYPASVVLFRRDLARFWQDGHCYRVELARGDIGELAAPILHDDRKPFSRWLLAQARYAVEEAEKISTRPWGELGWPDRVRRVPFVAAPLVFAHCMLVKGGALDGRPGLTYAGQRVIAEVLISTKLVQRARRARR